MIKVAKNIKAIHLASSLASSHLILIFTYLYIGHLKRKIFESFTRLTIIIAFALLERSQTMRFSDLRNRS